MSNYLEDYLPTNVYMEPLSKFYKMLQNPEELPLAPAPPALAEPFDLTGFKIDQGQRVNPQTNKLESCFISTLFTPEHIYNSTDIGIARSLTNLGFIYGKPRESDSWRLGKITINGEAKLIPRIQVRVEQDGAFNQLAIVNDQ